MILDPIIATRNTVERFFYKKVAKPFFFKRDPEDVHDRVTSLGARLGRSSLTRGVTSLLFSYRNPALTQKLHGITFTNPVGLAAGFDKNARLTSILPSVGFGWAEIGSITARPCAGNPKPRLHRLPKSEALVVYYGLMNDGCDVVRERLLHAKARIPLGTSIAPTNDELTSDYQRAIDEYVHSYEKLAEVGSYTTLNLSCPNTCNDQPFTDPEKLGELLAAVRKVRSKKPLFLKLSPDLSMENLDALLAVAKKHGVDGVICTNLLKNRENVVFKDEKVPPKGGISGRVVQAQSDAMIEHIATRWGTTFTIVGCGGVFSAEDAYRKIGLGASLIQMITGMVFEGPQVVSSINQGLAALLRRDGFSSISEAVGKDLKG